MGTDSALIDAVVIPTLDADIETVDAASNIDVGSDDTLRATAYLGGNRPATYALPYGYEHEQEMPLVISMHGFGSNSIGTMRIGD